MFLGLLAPLGEVDFLIFVTVGFCVLLSTKELLSLWQHIWLILHRTTITHFGSRVHGFGT